VHVKLLHKSRIDFVAGEKTLPTILLENLAVEIKGGDLDILPNNSPLHDNFSFLDLCLGSSNFHFCPLAESAMGVVVNDRHIPENIFILLVFYIGYIQDNKKHFM
jgi:hypothetical protein